MASSLKYMPPLILRVFQVFQDFVLFFLWPLINDEVLEPIETESPLIIDKLGGYEALEKYAMAYLADLKHQKSMFDRFHTILVSNGATPFKQEVKIESKQLIVDYDGARRKIKYCIGVNDYGVFLYSISKFIPYLDKSNVAMHFEMTKGTIWQDLIMWAYDIGNRVNIFEDLQEDNANAIEYIFAKHRGR